MTRSVATHTTSNRSTGTHCTVSIVSRSQSTLVTPNLVPTIMSDCLLHSRSLNLQMTSNFRCSYELHALSLTMPQNLTCLIFKTALSPPSCPTHWPSATRGGVENLPTSEIRQGNLELTALPHSLDNTRNTNMLPCPQPTYTLLWATPRTKWCHCSQPWDYNNTNFGRLYHPTD